MTDRTILTIDDDADLREFVLEAFEREGYRAIVVPDVAAGLIVLGALVVDLVLLGHGPRSLAYDEFVRTARERFGPRLPILLWTTCPRAEERARTMSVDGVIEKPTDLDVLLACVRHAIIATESASPVVVDSPTGNALP